MNAAQLIGYGEEGVVTINQRAPIPALAAGHLLVEVRAAGVNPIDWKIRQGYLQQTAPLKLPVTLGGDFSGVVREVGDGVSGFQKGDEVYGQAIVLGGGSGSFAEIVSTPAQSTAQKPKSVGHREAAALPLAGVSALQALTEHMILSKGHKILIHGGAGGIGTFAIQLAKHLGAYVATTASVADHPYVRELGADEVVDYTAQTFEDVIRDCDAVFDTVGGETTARSFRVLKRGGVLVSMLEQPNAELMERYGVTAIGQFTKVTTERLSKLAALVDQGALVLRVDSTFPLEQAGEALSYLQTGHPRGKVVVEVHSG